MTISGFLNNLKKVTGSLDLRNYDQVGLTLGKLTSVGWYLYLSNYKQTDLIASDYVKQKIGYKESLKESFKYIKQYKNYFLNI